MEKAKTPIIARVNGLRYVKTQSGYLMDQYGRCFEDKRGKPGKLKTCGYANH